MNAVGSVYRSHICDEPIDRRKFAARYGMDAEAEDQSMADRRFGVRWSHVCRHDVFAGAWVFVYVFGQVPVLRRYVMDRLRLWKFAKLSAEHGGFLHG